MKNIDIWAKNDKIDSIKEVTKVLRVISGTARGTKLESIENLSTRPTLDRVKEALFSMLLPYIQEETRVLDLFAGSGALGIECLSRGAQEVVFCDKSFESIKMLKQNIERTFFTKQSTIVNKDYKKCIQDLEKQTFSIIFVDPPYHLNIAVDACKRIQEARNTCKRRNPYYRNRRRRKRK